MESPRPVLVLDLVDPVSYLLEREVRLLEAEGDLRLDRALVELRPPPAPVTDTLDPDWAPRWTRAEAEGGTMTRPPWVPWSRKAHELVLHAREKGIDDRELVGLLFECSFVEEQDIGRVDVLVGVASRMNMDSSETKAVLDVDRFEAAAALASDRHKRLGVEVPAIVREGDRLEGFHNVSAIRTFLSQP